MRKNLPSTYSIASIDSHSISISDHCDVAHPHECFHILSPLLPHLKACNELDKRLCGTHIYQKAAYAVRTCALCTFVYINACPLVYISQQVHLFVDTCAVMFDRHAAYFGSKVLFEVFQVCAVAFICPFFIVDRHIFGFCENVILGYSFCLCLSFFLFFCLSKNVVESNPLNICLIFCASQNFG